MSRFLQKHDMDLICRAHQVVEDGYEFFSKRQLVTLFSAPNYCGEFDNAGAMMSVDESLLCSFQVKYLTHIRKELRNHANMYYLDIETSGKETKVRLRWHEHWQARHSSKETEEFQEVNLHVPIRSFRVQQVRAESIDLLLTTTPDVFIYDLLRSTERRNTTLYPQSSTSFSAVARSIPLPFSCAGKSYAILLSRGRRGWDEAGICTTAKRSEGLILCAGIAFLETGLFMVNHGVGGIIHGY